VGRPELKLLLASLGAEALYVGRCGMHHKFDVVGRNGLDNTGSRIVDGKGGGRVPTHEPDATSEDLHSQAVVARFCIVLITDVAAFFAIGTVLLGP
jgi:hypothetical protein